MKNYIGISRDHSASMASIAKAAARDYNETILGIKDGATKFGIDTIVSVVECGTRGAVSPAYGWSGQTINRMVVVNSNVNTLKPIDTYQTDGRNTPLFDSVAMLLDQLENVPDAGSEDVSFVVMVITDGEDNASKISGKQLAARIQKLQATDRWTFAFRVPRGGARTLIRLGIPAGNILEWEQTERGVEEATRITASAFDTYYQGRAAGTLRSSNTFYTNVADVSMKDIKANLVDISKDVDVYVIDDRNHGVMIRDFVNAQPGHTFRTGCAFYELSKRETIQDYKKIAIRDKDYGHVYGGASARQMLGLPLYGDAKVAPGDHGNYEIFVQSTSVNRKLVKGTNIMIWPGAV